MNRGLTRLIIAGLFLAISWGVYQLSDVTDCSGPKSDAWAEAFIARMDEAEEDYMAWDESTTPSEFVAYADRAEARYTAQYNAETIECLEGLQKEGLEFFWFELQMYESASAGDWEQAEEWDQKSMASLEGLEREYNKLAAKYDWEE
jgi:hypothetical protein